MQRISDASSKCSQIYAIAEVNTRSVPPKGSRKRVEEQRMNVHNTAQSNIHSFVNFV